MSKRRCVFFDRDGIVNKSPGDGYVERWSDFHLLSTFVKSLRVVRDMGFDAVVVTNQRGVAIGVMTLETVEDMHRRLRDRLREDGFELLDVMLCPHDRDQCECRKPKPGMLLEAARRHGIDLSASWMVGDHETDVEAGRRAGCRTIRVAPAGTETMANHRVDDMEALPGLLARILTSES
jgi:D-glycero-D-manno-heptose 1,7-bisphosphate phosphatase